MISGGLRLRKWFGNRVFASILLIRGELCEIGVFFVLQISIKSHAIEALVEAYGELGEEIGGDGGGGRSVDGARRGFCERCEVS